MATRKQLKAQPQLLSTYKWKKPSDRAFAPGSGREYDTYRVYKMPDGSFRTTVNKQLTRR